MFLPLQTLHSSQDFQVNTSEQLEMLLEQDVVVISLHIEGKAIDFNLIGDVLLKHSKTLRSLHLDGRGRTTSITETNSKKLEDGMRKCVGLQSLAFEYFYSDFGKNISIFSGLFPKLKQLIYLSFKYTHLALWKNNIFTHLTAKKLDLTHALRNVIWEYFLMEIEGNNVLEELILNDSPIHPVAIQNVIKIITAPKSSIKVLDWRPKPFYENEIDQNISDIVNPDESKKTNNHLPLKLYSVACQQLALLQSFIEERNNPRPKMELVIEIPDESHFNLDYIAGIILLHSVALQKLTIRMANIEKEVPQVKRRQFQKFTWALSKCTRLHSLKIENFQGTFHNDQIVGLFFAIEQLASLEILSFKKTYIGPIGIERLTRVIEKGKLLELDLTLSGLICYEDVITLSNAIAHSTTLQTVNLGKSPLIITWWHMLCKATALNPNAPTIEWEPTNKEVMNLKMFIICTELCKQGILNRYTSAHLIRNFAGQDDGLQWEKVEADEHKSTYANLNIQLPAKTEQGFEMETFIPTSKSPLLQVQPKAAYGTCDSSIPPGPKKAP